MKRHHRRQSILRDLRRSIMAASALAVLAACGMKQSLPDFDGITFREDRYQDITAMRTFQSCRDEAVGMDEQARSSGDPARYLASARLLERCESDLGADASTVSADERMRAYGLTVQNYIKGGDAGSARRNLERFKQTFPDKDLYYPDGSSFRETMEVLLGHRDPKDFGQYATINVSSALKDEMRRLEYWKHN